MYFLYRHISNNDNKPFYIGIGKKLPNPVSYRNEYLRAFVIPGRSSRWTNYAKKYGYSVEIMTDCETLEEARQREKYFIQLYQRKIINSNGLLVNISPGGELSFCTEEHKKIISERMRGNKNGVNQIWDEKRRERAREIMLEKIHSGVINVHKKDSEETKMKKSLVQKGKRLTKEQRERLLSVVIKRKIICIETNIEYPSISECVRQMFGWNRAIKNSIILVLKGKNKNYKGYHFKYI